MQWKFPIAAILATVMAFWGPFVSVSRARIVTTEALSAQTDPAGRADVRQAIHRTLDRPEIVLELARLGVDPSEAHRRIDALSDAQVLALKGKLDSLPAGSGVVGLVVGAILIVFFVLLFTDLIGATDVFPWVRKH